MLNLFLKLCLLRLTPGGWIDGLALDEHSIHQTDDPARLLFLVRVLGAEEAVSRRQLRGKLRLEAVPSRCFKDEALRRSFHG